MLNRWDVINAFIEKHNYKRYLEIGYYKGWSFDQVKCQNKWAVDPNPCKFPEQEKMLYGTTGVINKMTSDDYFVMQTEGAVYDIIFIDGLHEASQVEKDINNALKHLSPGGTIVLHDCNPPKYEHTTTGIDGCWTGDTYKAFVKFRLQYPEYESFTVDTDWGCGVICNNFIRDWTVDTPTEEILPMLEWEYFSVNKTYLLGLISVEEFKTKMNEGITNIDLSAK